MNEFMDKGVQSFFWFLSWVKRDVGDAPIFHLSRRFLSSKFSFGKSDGLGEFHITFPLMILLFSSSNPESPLVMIANP